MSRQIFALLVFALTLSLSACTTKEPEQAAKKAAAAPAVLKAPAGNDDKEWKQYLQQVVGQHMDGVTDRVFPYYLPANSTVPTPGDATNRSQYDRQLENVQNVMGRNVLPGNMLVFGSPDSAKMADLLIAAVATGKPDALKGSQILFIGKAEDNARVQVAAQSVGAKYIFVEAK
jgi:hypothetical protein